MARPAGQDTKETRARILDTALDEFAAKGFDGARLDAIVEACGFNVNTIYYHFGSKEALFVAVMEEAYRKIRAEHRELELAELPPEEAIARLSRHIFRIFMNDQRLVALLDSENLHRAAHIAKSDQIRGMYDGIIDAIAGILAEGVVAGVFQPGIDARELFITISALGYFYVSNQYTLSVILDERLHDPSRIARREDHVVAVVLGYLRDKAPGRSDIGST